VSDDGWYIEAATDEPVSPVPVEKAAAGAVRALDGQPAHPVRVPVFVETAAYLDPSGHKPDDTAAPRKATARLAVVEEETPAEVAARAESISMSALTRKGMSSWEMADRLRSRDLDEDAVQNEVSRLERVGLLDDRQLAETLVRTLQERKGLGRSGITAELRRRHVDQVAIEEALDALDGEDEIARATEIAVKRAGQLRSYDTVTAKRRLSAFMQRKGYSGSVVSAAVAAALGPAGSGSGPRFR
jgi:regulatory protein